MFLHFSVTAQWSVKTDKQVKTVCQAFSVKTEGPTVEACERRSVHHQPISRSYVRHVWSTNVLAKYGASGRALRVIDCPLVELCINLTSLPFRMIVS